MVGLQHLQKRKRVHQKIEDYPHPNKWKRFLDKGIYLAGILGPIMTLPQLSKIWIEKNASGVSAFSWGAYAIGAVFWIVYGFMHKEKPIILAYFSWFMLSIFIVLGTLLYG